MMGETWAPMLLVAGSYLAMFGSANCCAGHDSPAPR